MLHFLDGFSSSVKDAPDAIAVQDSVGYLTYLQLDDLSSCFASFLLEQGLQANDVVAVDMDRSRWLWVVVLGTFKAGCVYLPVDRNWPRSRYHYVLEKASVSLLIADGGIGAASSELGIPVVSYDDLDLSELQANFASQCRSTLAYIFFTSGSTGRPKGVLIRHDALANLLDAMKALLDTQPGSVQLCLSPLVFDLVIPDLFLPLIAGAKCFMASAEQMSDLPWVISQLAGQEVTYLAGTPALYESLLAAHWQPSSQLTLMIGGDRVPAVLADSLVNRVASLWHCYGPTEATVWCSMSQHRLACPMAIGRSLRGYELFVLDDANTLLTTVGDVGELHIAGRGLAEGYIDEPDLTAEKFVDVFVGGQKKQLYKSGDLVKIQENHGLMFVGRKDSLVKLRGYRIELGEIENIALEHPEVQQCVAVLVNDTFIRACVVSHASNIEFSLRQLFASKLAWYMLPTQIVLLDALPLTANKKIDRNSLSGDYSSFTDLLEVESVSPDPNQVLVKQAWADIFKDQVSIHDNFFWLGGDSQQALRLVVELEKALRVELPLSFVYAYPSIALMCRALRAEDISKKQEHDDVVLLRRGNGPVLVCFPPIGGGVYHYQRLASLIPDEHHLIGLPAQGFHGERPLYSIAEMATRFAQIVLPYAKKRSVRFIGGSMGGVLALETAKQLRDLGVCIDRVYMLDTWGALSPGGGQSRLARISPYNSARLRWQDFYMSLTAQLAFARQQKLPSERRYKYLAHVNYNALRHYFRSKDFLQEYEGDVALLRLPIKKDGLYSSPELGWKKTLPGLSKIAYIDASHENFIESDAFSDVFVDLYR